MEKTAGHGIVSIVSKVQEKLTSTERPCVLNERHQSGAPRRGRLRGRRIQRASADQHRGKQAEIQDGDIVAIWRVGPVGLLAVKSAKGARCRPHYLYREEPECGALAKKLCARIGIDEHLENMIERTHMTAFQWMFQARQSGHIVIVQAPNVLFWLFVGSFALAYVLPVGWPTTTARIVGFVGVALWALDELARGVNPWRRLLGAATLLSVASYVVWTLWLRS